MKAFTLTTVSLALLMGAVEAGMLRSTTRPMPGYERFVAQTKAESMALLDGPYYIEGSSDSESQMVFPEINEGSFTQPLDHFSDSINVTFEQRYWYSLRHYKPASQRPAGQPVPVYVLDGGETYGDGRLPFLDHGILDILANATGGISIVLEHRYYGTSFPARSELGPGEVWSSDEMRWLTYNQTLQDSVRFAQNLKIPGVDEDLTAPNAARVISYGGSYAGTKSAHLRVLFPETFFGSIASSAVVAAIEAFGSYFYPLARGTDPLCSQSMQAAIGYIDSIIAPDPTTGSVQPKRDANATADLLDLFGLTGLQKPDDLSNLLTNPLGGFQALNWDKRISSNSYSFFCQAITNTTTSGPVPIADDIRNGTVQPVYTPPVNGSVVPSDATIAGKPVPSVVQRLIKYMRDTYIDKCASKYGAEDCFGTADWSSYTNATDPNDIAWAFQYCQSFSYSQLAPPPVTTQSSPINFSLSGPKLVSTLLDNDFSMETCRKGFPPGKFFQMPATPNVTEINSIGGFASPFDISYDRLAFINGQYDPWRSASIHSEEYAYGGAREDTDLRPSILIPDAWHHQDENSLPADQRHLEPPRIKAVHERMVKFVKSWLELPESSTTFEQQPPTTLNAAHTPGLSFARDADALVL